MGKIDTKPCQTNEAPNAAPPDLEAEIKSQGCDPESNTESIETAASRSNNRTLRIISSIVYVFIFAIFVFCVIFSLKVSGTRAALELLAMYTVFSLVSLGVSLCHKNYKGPRRMLFMSFVWFTYIIFLAFAFTFEVSIFIRAKDRQMGRFFEEELGNKNRPSEDL